MIKAMTSGRTILVLGWPGDRMLNKHGLPQQLQDLGICDFRNQSESRQLRGMPTGVGYVLCTEMVPTPTRRALSEAAGSLVSEPMKMGMIDKLLEALYVHTPAPSAPSNSANS